MPAGYGKRCQDCYWYNLLLKRIKINCAAFSSQQMADHFASFGQWLGLRQGNNKAALTINKYLLFFTDVEQQWQLIPNFHALLNHFGTLRLRRALLPMRWMEENHLIVFDDEAKKEDSEKRRIASILGKIPNNSLECSILDAYRRNLVNKLQQQKTTLRSIRLALTPAAALLLVARKKGHIPPNQSALDGYLGKTPGQRASVSGFVRYLNEKYGVGIALPKINLNKSQKNGRKKLEVKILALMNENTENEGFSRKWLSMALAYFHGLPEKVGHVIKLKNVSLEEDGGISVTWNEMSYWIPVFSSEK